MINLEPKLNKLYVIIKIVLMTLLLIIIYIDVIINRHVNITTLILLNNHKKVS